MLIDAVFFILIALAFYKGLRKGFIIAIFSVLGFVVGIAAALKLSSTVASKIASYTDIGKWLPALSFLLVFIGVAFLVNFCGKLIQKTFETVMLGWVNRLAGAALYVLLYSMLFSVFFILCCAITFFKSRGVYLLQLCIPT